MNKKLWGGRFKSEQDPLFWKFQSSIGYDKELAAHDVSGSIAHVSMLKKCKVIPHKAAEAILKGLVQIQKSIRDKKFVIDPKAEDIHTAIYNCLYQKIGDKAEYMHTARSRNDQVVLDLKMYCKDKISSLTGLVKKLQLAMTIFAKDNIDVIMPGLTHTQHAVPILLSHQFLAYVNMLERDIARLDHAKEHCDEMPLGSCALAGTSFTIDRKYVAKLLGFSKISENSIDAVSDRDFVIEASSAISILFMHLSRLCEDLIMFQSPEFSFIDIDEAFCTGSSIMPQKKNPDSLELIRGCCGKIYANTISCMVMMKGLPLSYNRDMQFDKEPLFESIRLTEDALGIFIKLIKSLKVNVDKLESVLKQDESIFALDIADYLVNKGMAFSKAHSVTGSLIKYAADKKVKLSVISLDELQAIAKEFDRDMYKIFDPKRSIMSKRSLGSTNPILVRQQIDKWLKELKEKDKG